MGNIGGWWQGPFALQRNFVFPAALSACVSVTWEVDGSGVVGWDCVVGGDCAVGGWQCGRQGKKGGLIIVVLIIVMLMCCWWGWWLMVVEIMVVDSVVADKEKSALMSATQYAREGMAQLRVGWQTTSAGGSPHQSGDPNIDLRQGHTLWLRDQCLVRFGVVWNLLSCKYWYLVKYDILQRWYLVKKISTCSKK